MKQYTSLLKDAKKRTSALPHSPLWEVTEKVDGSNFRADFATPRWGSRTQFLNPFAGIMQNFAGAVASCETALAAGLPCATTRHYHYFGEAFSTTRGNKLTYERPPKGGVCWFDVYDPDAETYLVGERKFEVLRRLADATMTEIPEPLVIPWNEITDDFVADELDKPSFLGGVREGIVIKPWNHPVINQYGERAVFKVVSEAFAEKAVKKMRRPVAGDFDQIVSEYATDMRIQKAVTRLRDEGRFDEATVAKNIGPLIGVVAQDILAEEGDIIRATLFNAFKKRMGSSLGQSIRDFVAKGDM